ncbi:hypothetical protein ACFLZ1_04985 [Patescibacteria group bacterium]
MKKLKKLLLFVGLAAFLFLIVVGFLLKKDLLSPDQKEIIKLFGPPSQFVITHLPRGDADNPKLVRTETWYYSENNKKFSFLAGEFIGEEDYQPSQEEPATSLKPEDFDFYMSFDDVADILGEENIEPIDFLPVFYEEGELATYLSDEAMFVIENNQLLYFQTLFKSEAEELEDQDLLEEEEVKVEPSSESDDQSSWKTYQNSDFKIRLEYPSDWFWVDNDIVLSSYDPEYLSKDLELPATRLKCDLTKYNEDDAEIIDEESFANKENFTALKGVAQDNSDIDGPGLGDAVMFVIRRENKDTLALLCFAYDKSFEEDLFKMFDSLEFLD